MNTDYIAHHGILGMKWGVRRYQNYDGSLTDDGRSRYSKSDERRDIKWTTKKGAKIEKAARKSVSKEINRYQTKELNQKYQEQLSRGTVSKNYINEYNRKLASLMNEEIGTVEAPSGRVLKFVAKRGEVGVYMALADSGYDMSQVKNGVFDTGKVAYRKKSVDMR